MGILRGEKRYIVKEHPAVGDVKSSCLGGEGEWFAVSVLLSLF